MVAALLSGVAVLVGCSGEGSAAESVAEPSANATRLHDIWVLRKIDGESLPAERLPKGLPVFEFFVRDGRFLTSGGCNSFETTIEVSDTEIRFGTFVGTKMACPNPEIEAALVEGLEDRVVPYRFTKRGLVLEGGHRFILQKID